MHGERREGGRGENVKAEKKKEKENATNREETAKESRRGEASVRESYF